MVIGFYQDRTHRTNNSGADLSPLINVKYGGAAGSAVVSGVNILVTGHTLATIPQSSGTIILRFTEPNNTNVVTQNAILRAIDLTAGFLAPDIGAYVTNITVQAAQLADTAGNAGNAAWTAISAGDLSLNNQSMSAAVHDFHVIISASPQAVGTKITWGFYCQLEYL